MSYDIDIGKHWFNYTSNVAPLFYDHIPPSGDECRGGLHALNGKTGKQAAAIIADALDAIDRSMMAQWVNGAGHKAFTDKYDAPNGWGSTVGAIMLLARMMAACHANPRVKVKVSA